jgi:hypothetical protein
MRIVVNIASPGGRLSRPFQLMLNACIEAAAAELKRKRVHPLYLSDIDYRPEPWAGEGVEEFADPYTVADRKWGDCDDLVIYRGAELLAAGYPCHACIVHQVPTNKYHTQLTRDFGGGEIEDPSLQRLGKPWLFHPHSRLPLPAPLRGSY